MITLDLSDKCAGDGRENIPALRSFVMRASAAVPVTGEVSVLLTSDREIRRLNRTFRGKDKATDVLSFPMLHPSASSRSSARAKIAGDLAISIDTAQRQAMRFGHPLKTELKILLLHGLLHLAGYDHEMDAGEMAARENELRGRFRLPITVIARNDIHPAPERAAHNGRRS